MTPALVLRDYQVEAVEALRQCARDGKRRLLLVCPTGGGKTIIFCEIVRSAMAKGARALILAHRRELVAQASDKLRAVGVEHGIIQAGVPGAPQRSVQVASVQTLARRPGVLSSVDIVVIDECHHTQADSYERILSWYPNALVLGVTATPWRLDGKGLADVFDGHVLARTPRELRDEGFLVGVGGWEYEAVDSSEARVRGGDFVASEMEASATSRRVVGDVVDEWCQHAAGLRTVAFACTVAHSRAMVEAFCAAGVAAEHLDGETPTAERDAILARLRAGQTQVVCNCNVLTEGVDLPELEVAILARPTLSAGLYLQMCGRILRPAPGKTLARIHDHAGCLAAHGHPYAERNYDPRLTALVARKEHEARKVSRRCPKCFSVLARWPCDACGHAPSAEELRVGVAEIARQNAITEDGTTRGRSAETDEERRFRWLARWADDDEWKRAFWFRMVAKHGPVKARRVYWWFSGMTEWPQWSAEAKTETLGAAP